jgi:flagellar basal-body rod protein FlgB
MFDKLTSNMKLLEKSIGAAWLRNDVITQNLANVDTPGYKRKTVAFEEYLSDALDNSSFKGTKTDKRHIDIGGSNAESVSSRVQVDNSSLSYRLDGNNVDAENENASLAKNAIKYNALVQSLSSEIKRVKLSISEGRK